MKKMKKLFAVILSLAMVLGMSVTAFAAEPKTADVTVKQLKTGTKVAYVKLIEPDNSSKGWKFTADMAGKDIGMTLDEIIKAANGQTDTNANTGTINAALTGLDFFGFASLVTSSENKDNYAIASTDGEVKFENMGAGLYAIQAIDPSNEYVYSWMVAYVGYTEGTADNPVVLENVEVTAKGAKDDLTKTVEEKNWSVATDDTVTYTVTKPYPYYTANTQNSKVFTIQDTITNGRFADDLNLQVSVKPVGGDTETPVKEGTGKGTYALTGPDGTDTFTVDLGGEHYNTAWAGWTVTLKYDVVATTTVSNLPLTNDVKSEITMPDGSASIKASEIITPAVSAEITKVDNENTNLKLEGAVFSIYKGLTDDAAAEATHVYTPKRGDTPAKIEEKSGNSKEADQVWVKLIKESDPTGKDGKAKFDGLDAQETYYVVETTAPEGYSLNTEAFVLGGAGITSDSPIKTENVLIDINKTPDNANDDVTGVRYEYKATNFSTLSGSTDMIVKDTNLASLPSTGGIGTTIFTIGGCLIMIVAAALFFASRRKSSK